MKKGEMCMKGYKKKICAGLLAIVMLCGLLGIPAWADAGEPFQVTDAFTLNFGNNSKVPAYDYYSPRTLHTIMDRLRGIAFCLGYTTNQMILSSMHTVQICR